MLGLVILCLFEQRLQAQPQFTILGPTDPITFVNGDPAATALNIKNALVARLNLNAGVDYTNSVVVTPSGSDFLISFQDRLARSNIGNIVPTFAGTLLPLGTASITAATTLEGGGNTSQVLQLSGPGGTVLVSFNGQSATVPLTFIPSANPAGLPQSPTAAQVQAALRPTRIWRRPN